jgi:type VI secretion system protein ImpL
MKSPVAVATGAALLLVLAWVLPAFSGLAPRKTLALQLILSVAILLIAAAAVWYANRKSRKPSGPPGATDGAASPELASILQEAESKLSSSPLGRDARLSRLPVILVTGPEGSAKTTVVLRSGLEPELLAGQVSGDGIVIPTSIGNAWLAQKSVFIELGPATQADARTWHSLAKHLQPGKLASAVARSEGAPRAIVVCYECENLLKPGAPETAAETAKGIRAQLYQLSSKLGSNLPVYVLFTKLDRVAFFFEYAKNLDRGEAAQILGATLAVEKPNTGVYGEREAARLGQTFTELALSLSDKRTELLAREADPELTLSAYEFPREFRKMRSAAVNFLLELCRPSQLSVGPFLRGFYFTGVRPVIVNEEAAAEIERPVQHRTPANPDATSIFYRGAVAEEQPRASGSRSAKRKLPDWVFLPAFFRGVVLNDRSGLAASAASTKTNFSRRLLFGSVTALCLLLGIATLVSFIKNDHLTDDVRRAAAEVSSDNSSAQTVPLESLIKLDSLRQSLAQLTGYERTHPPLSMRWGLYTGSDILPDARRIYFARFKTLFFDTLQGRLVETMRSWPATPPPQADYGYDYNTLKAYLEMTSNHEKATLQFLPPLLQERWVANQTVDGQKIALARRQFDFYTAELAVANPYPVSADGQIVSKARQFLVQFGGVERTYQAMLTEANSSQKSIIFNQQFPGSSAVVINNVDVRGAFTKPGFAFMENAIKNPSQYAKGEKWVLGDQSSGKGDSGNLQQQIQALYDRDYIAAWREYLKRSSIVRYASLSDAAKKLVLTSSAQSPLLALFSVASQNTDVSSPAVQKAFKTLHTLMPPGSVDSYVAPSNANYMTSLTTLQNTLDQAAKMPPEQAQAAADQTSSAASSALLAARSTSLTLGLDPEAHIEATIQKLLTDPITYVEAVKPNGSNPAPLNAAGADFCSKYRGLFAKFPFDPNAKAKADVQEVNGIFRPQAGALWQFYDQKLNKLLLKQGSIYVPAPAQKPEVTARFASFFNNAARLSNALYASGTSQDPKLVFALQPAFSSDIQSVALSIDGQTSTLQAGSGPQRFTWPGDGAGVRLVARSGTEFSYPNYDGTWGLFEFFFDADKPLPNPEWMLKGGRSDKPVTSPLTNQPIAVRFNVDMLGGPPVFQKGYFKELACVSEVAK